EFGYLKVVSRRYTSPSAALDLSKLYSKCKKSMISALMAKLTDRPTMLMAVILAFIQRLRRISFKLVAFIVQIFHVKIQGMCHAIKWLIYKHLRKKHLLFKQYECSFLNGGCAVWGSRQKSHPEIRERTNLAASPKGQAEPPNLLRGGSLKWAQARFSRNQSGFNATI